MMNWRKCLRTAMIVTALAAILSTSALAANGNGKSSSRWGSVFESSNPVSLSAVCDPIDYNDEYCVDEPEAIDPADEAESDAIMLEDWFRITPCYKLEWQHDGLQKYVVVAKKGSDYTIWTRDELTEAQKAAVYESFSTNVNGMFGAKYENCQFMYADGSTLDGVTINGDYISFDAHSTWSMYAVGTFREVGPSIFEVIQPEEYTVYHMTVTNTPLAIEYGTAMGGDTVTVSARDFSNQGYSLSVLSVPVDTIDIKPTQICEFQEFEIFDGDWFRITPCYKLNWQHDGLQQYVVVAKKGNDYTIWTKDELSAEEQQAVYDSFSTNVNGMFGAKFKNCQFMYANGSSLAGVTINDDYISFDAHSSWSMYAVGSYLPAYEWFIDTGADNSYTFYYDKTGVRR